MFIDLTDSRKLSVNLMDQLQENSDQLQKKIDRLVTRNYDQLQENLTDKLQENMISYKKILLKL